MVAKASSKSAGLDTGIGSTAEAKAGRDLLRLRLEAGKRSDVMGVVDDADALDLEIELLEKLEALGGDSFELVHHTGDVSTRPRERGHGGHGAQSYRVHRAGHDDGDGRSRAARCFDRLHVAGHNHVDLERNKFHRQIGERAGSGPALGPQISRYIPPPSRARAGHPPGRPTGVVLLDPTALPPGHPRAVVCRETGSKPELLKMRRLELLPVQHHQQPDELPPFHLTLRTRGDETKISGPRAHRTQTARDRCVAIRASNRGRLWVKSAVESSSAFGVGRTSRPLPTVKECHVWTAPALQEESDISAKGSGAAMYSAF